MNYNAMSQYLTNIKLVNNNFEISYLNFDNKEISIQVPLNELTVDYFGNGIGISSLIGHCIKIEQRGKTKIKQYSTEGWTNQDLKETVKKLREIKKQY